MQEGYLFERLTRIRPGLERSDCVSVQTPSDPIKGFAFDGDFVRHPVRPFAPSPETGRPTHLICAGIKLTGNGTFIRM